MITKLNLMKSAMVRLENNREFFAYFLKIYREAEAISELQLIALLKCSPDDYYKLALCKAPDVDAPDFLQRLQAISQYTNIVTEHLNDVIKNVNSLIKFARKPGNDVAMAARDKKNTDEHSDK